MIIAARGEATRQAIAARSHPERRETAMFNLQVVILCKANGTVEIRADGGAAAPLATLADVQALSSFFQHMTLSVPVPLRAHQHPARSQRLRERPS